LNSHSSGHEGFCNGMQSSEVNWRFTEHPEGCGVETLLRLLRNRENTRNKLLRMSVEFHQTTQHYILEDKINVEHEPYHVYKQEFVV
jgi:hypothetical protein